MAEEFGVVIKGIREVSAGLDRKILASNEGTRAALGKATSHTKTRIRGGMRGAPRWAHKGADRTTGAPAVNLDRTPDHIRRSGGPGQLTGSLYGSIRKSRKPRLTGVGSYSQVVMAGGKGGYQNRYKAEIESRYPFFKPGVDKATPKVRAIFEAAWGSAVNKS